MLPLFNSHFPMDRDYETVYFRSNNPLPVECLPMHRQWSLSAAKLALYVRLDFIQVLSGKVIGQQGIHGFVRRAHDVKITQHNKVGIGIAVAVFFCPFGQQCRQAADLLFA